MKPQITVLIADDHPIVRQGLRQTIENDPGLRIVAEAADGSVAWEQLLKLRPEVAVLDIDMPVQDGFAVATAVREHNLPVAVIFLTIHREEELFQAAMDMGVKGYVLKDSATTDIVAGIKTVAGGRSYISPSLSEYLINRRGRAAELVKEKPGIEELTPMERRILKLIADDKTSKEIAEELFISHRTVETHRTNISRKLDLHGSLALIKFALAHKGQL